jgi:hypothetical protein
LQAARGAGFRLNVPKRHFLSTGFIPVVSEGCWKSGLSGLNALAKNREENFLKIKLACALVL